MTSEAGIWSGRRIGVLGGTFDPPHLGHARMAEAARRTLELDRVVFSAAANPPHKRRDAATPYAHRAAMLALAVEGVEGAELSRVEESHDPSFTIDLLRACRSRTSADLYFIIGADSLLEFATWKDPQAILEACTLVVFPRGRAPMVLPVGGDASVVVFEERVIDVSSSEIRRLVAAGEVPEGVLAPAVASYIARHGLYAGA
jgi:nicotinate-nucleotide adenylyltransferase